MTSQLLIDLELASEIVVLIPWQKHCHELSVYLEQRTNGWFGAFSYCPRNTRLQGLFAPYSGPWPSRQTALSASVVFGVFQLHPSTPKAEKFRLLATVSPT